VILLDSNIPMCLIGPLASTAGRTAAVGERRFDALLGVVDDVLAIDLEDAQSAKDILLRYETLSARDAIHVAVMHRNGIERIMSFDRGFDSHPGIERVA